jgi:hypothetical protein
VHGDGVGIGHEIGFADEARADFPGLGFGQVRTPSDNVHIERNGVAGYPRAKTTETDDAQRFAGEPMPTGTPRWKPPARMVLSALGMARAAATSRPSAKFGRSLGRPRAATGRVADRNALTCASRDVQRGV